MVRSEALQMLDSDNNTTQVPTFIQKKARFVPVAGEMLERPCGLFGVGISSIAVKVNSAVRVVQST
jgi:hypothetical protein